MLVCDLATLVVTDPLLTTFELESRVAEALRRGAFDEIDLVADLLKPVRAAQTPNEEQATYGEGLWDRPRFRF